MARFEIDEKVIVKDRNIMIHWGRIITITEGVWGYGASNSCPLYKITKMNTHEWSFAVDNKNRCSYVRSFPAYRIFKLEEA